MKGIIDNCFTQLEKKKILFFLDTYVVVKQKGDGHIVEKLSCSYSDTIIPLMQRSWKKNLVFFTK